MAELLPPARYPATPVDCLLSELSELWDAPFEIAPTREQVIEHVREAVGTFHAGIGRGTNLVPLASPARPRKSQNFLGRLDSRLDIWLTRVFGCIWTDTFGGRRGN